MRWNRMRRSENVDDRTAAGGGRPFGGGMRIGGGTLIVVVIVSLVFGVNPLTLLDLAGGGGTVVTPQPQSAPPGQRAPARDKTRTDPHAEFVERVLGDTEDVWSELFRNMGAHYAPPRLTLFRDTVVSHCGRASAASGPFYCPPDQRVYLDTTFFRELSGRFGAPGDFAQAYVIAHEIGHHVQNLSGTMRKYDQTVAALDPRQRNALSVRLELQADCYAGVWGHFAARRNLLEPGDLEEGMRAASAVGDDAIQKGTQGRVVPDAFTHGSSTERVRWFRVGLGSGDPLRCDTFSTN